MKITFILFIFLYITASYSQVNFSTYGVVGDGVADDTQALRNALDNEQNLVANPNLNLKISGTLFVNQVANQTIDWNAARIFSNTILNPIMSVSKNSVNGGTTTMSDLLLDGNGNCVRGLYAESRLILNNVDVTNLDQGAQGTVSPAGFYFRVKNDADSMGSWTLNDCDITDLVGTSTGPLTNCAVASNTDGSVNGVLFYWDTAPSTETIITWNNLTIDGMWGDDAGGFFVNDFNNIGSTTSKHVVNDSFIGNCERRALKGFASNMEFNNVTFEAPLASNPNIQCGTISGLVVFGYENRRNVFFDNCTFIATSYEDRIIPVSIHNWYIKNSTFLGGARIMFTNLNLSAQNVQDGFVECNTFSSSSYIAKYSVAGTWEFDTIDIGGNTWLGGEDNRLASNEYNVTNPDCSGGSTTPDPPTPTTGSKGQFIIKRRY